jgi:hypothetical protein
MHHTAGDKQSPYFIHGDALFTPALQKRLAANRFPTTLSLWRCRSLAAPPPEQSKKINYPGSARPTLLI